MAITLDGTTGVTAPTFDGAIDATDLTGDVAAERITTALNATGSAPMYACRAWVNFDGQGTVAIRASGNVSSITDNGVGDYTINYTVSLPVSAGGIILTTNAGSATLYGYSSSNFRMQVRATTTSALTDAGIVTATAFA